MATNTAPSGQQLRGALDSNDGDDILGKIYDRGMFKRIFGYLGEVKWHLVIGAVGIVLRTAANMVTPLLVAMATDRMIDGNVDGLTIVVLFYLGVLAVIWFSQYLETLHLSYTAQGILLKMRTNMFGHLHKLSMSFFDHNKIGKLMSRVQNDVDQLQTLVAQNIVMVGVNLITLIGIIAIMLSINWQLALLSLSTLPVLVIVIIIWQRAARKAFVLARKAIAMVNDNLQESISGVKVTQNLSREAQNVKNFDEVNKANLEANKKAALLQGLIAPVFQVLIDVSYVIVLIFGGFQVLDGTMPVGFLLAFLLYIQRIGGPIQQLGTVYTDIQRAMASGARIFELLDVEPEIEDAPNAENLAPGKGGIVFENVSFGYGYGGEVIHDISFTVAPGETVAIVGRTGAGKSSIASLMNRFYDVESGRIFVDGKDIRKVTQDSLRSRIGFVPQDPFLFSGTIEENILDGKPGSDHEAVVKAAQAAGADAIISRMENGYQTEVGERGGNLSPGQRQLICLARAILSDPSIMILDEATSNIDTNTEKIIQDSFTDVSKGRTCVVIAHRLSTVTGADRIIVLESGRIIETGNHKQLMDRKGTYFDMFETLRRTDELD